MHTEFSRSRLTRSFRNFLLCWLAASCAASAQTAAPGRMAGPAERIAGVSAPLGGMNLTAAFDGAPARPPDPLDAALPAACEAPRPPAWDGIPGQRIEPLTSLDQLRFSDPALAQVARAAGEAYNALRAEPPSGRLGGRKEAFTQRDLTGAWALSFRRNFLQLVGSAVPAPLASLVAYYLALEYSYGRALDFDPATPSVGDRSAFERIAEGLARSLAESLSLPLPPGPVAGPLGLVDAVARLVTRTTLAELRDKAGGVDPEALGAAAKPPPASLGRSGAVLRKLEDMSRSFMTEVQVDGETTRIESAWRLVEHLDEAVQHNHVVALVGPTGTGKSVSVKWLAASYGAAHLTVAMKQAIGPGEMIGSVRPTPAGLAWQWGFLVKAMVEGSWVTLEEANLAPSEVLEFLNEFMNSGFLRLTQFLDAETLQTVLPPEIFQAVEAGGFVLRPHPSFRLFLTMNPDTYSGRNPLSKTLLNRTVQLWVPEYTPREMALLLQSRTGLDGATAMHLVENLYGSVKNAVAAQKLGREHKDRYELNFRSLLRAADLHKENLELYRRVHSREPDARTAALLLGRASWETFGSMMRSAEDRAQLWHLIDISFGMNAHGISLEEVQPQVSSIRLEGDEVVFDDAVLPIRIKVRPGGRFVPPQSFGLAPTPKTLGALYWMARRIALRQNFLLVGNTAAGKTTQVQYLHRLINAALYYTSLSSDSANEEIEGGYQPAPHKPGKFDWAPGKLQKAGEEYEGRGSTLFIDEFNLSGVVETINTPLDDGYIMTPSGPRRLGPDTTGAGAMNPPGYQSRNMLSPALRGRFWELWIEEPDGEEAALRVGWRLKQLMGKK
ncbi:MAG: AAA family ATPase [Elusimicrobia bacterium]|nr:AAA family ATPase [Elusimicrobiota bacterium]